MNDQLVVISKFQPLVKTDDKAVADFKELTQASDFLPRYQLCTFQTKVVQQSKIAAGRFGIVYMNRVVDLGPESTVIPYAYRYKALDMRVSPPKGYCDKESKDFKDIQTIALSKVNDNKCLVGVEFLVWEPTQREFCTFYFSNTTLKNMANDYVNYLNKPVHQKAEYIDRNGFRWHGMIILPSTLPIDYPSQDRLDTEVDKFVAEMVTEEDEPAPETRLQ